MKSDLEKDVLLHALKIGIGYQLYETIVASVTQGFSLLVIINLSVGLTLLLLHVITNRLENIQWVILLTHAIALSGFSYFWINFGGMAGTVPSFLCLYVVFAVTAVHGWVRWVVLSTLVVALFIGIEFPHRLGMKSYYEPQNIQGWQKAVDYLVIAGVVMSFGIFLKKRFLFYRDKVAVRHQQLKKIAYTHQSQNQELALRQEETRAINENLEALVEDRTKESEKRYGELSEYAFINAHLLRGPLCRIIGLINLMEAEPQKYPAGYVGEMKKLAADIDNQIRTINRITTK